MMLMRRIKLFGQNVSRFERSSLYRHQFPVVRSVGLKPKSCFTKTHIDKFRKKGHDIGQPYKTLLIFLVGKSRCVEAVESFKEMAYCLAMLLSRQCKVHTSRKVYQGLRLYAVYSRMWGEEMTSKMLSRLRKSLLVGGKSLLLSAVCVTPYNWDKNKISDEKLDSCIQEYESIGALCAATVFCDDCHKRQVIDKKVMGVDYCLCRGTVAHVDRSREFESWEPFLESENILVWRRKHHLHSHLFSYKVFGSYDDMSLSSFLEVQLNASFRTQWDATALELKVIHSQEESSSDLLYWLVKFPHFFANRDYVFQRRYRLDAAKREVVILNQIAEDPTVGVQKGVHRVREYYSIMVIRANEEFSKPGMSYTLTYFDNPGTSLPTAVTNFVACTAFPDFLRKVHRAAMSLQRRWENGEDVYVSLPPKLRGIRRQEDVHVKEVYPPLELEPGTCKEEATPFTNESDREMSKLSHLHVIKEALMNSDTDNSEVQRPHAQRGYKIPLKFKKAVIDLLEAIEVTSPDYGEKTMLTEKIEKLVDQLGLDGKKKSELVRRLEVLRSKTKKFMDNAAKKKEESIKIMNEFERRKYYYDQNSADADDRALVLFKALLKNINDVLKADRDMRTGKSFGADDSPPLRTRSGRSSQGRGDRRSPSRKRGDRGAKDQADEDKDDDTSNTSNTTSHFDKLKPTVVMCACCQCHSLKSVDEASPSKPWYHFPWWGGSNSTGVDTPNHFSRGCTCEHKRIENEQRTLSNTTQPESLITGVSTWFYNLFVPSAKPVSSSNNNNNDSRIGGDEPERPKVVMDEEETVPWYFLPWLPKFWTRASV